MGEPKTKPSYRLAAFAHWANLSLLATGVFAGVAIDPMYFFALVPLEAALLWAVPDLPPFRSAIDKRDRRKRMRREREFYLEQLFGLRPRPAKTTSQKLLGMLIDDEPDDADDRVIGASLELDRYLEMREIVSSLRKMVPLENVRVTEADIERVEQVVHGYLVVLFACRPLHSAIQAAERDNLTAELEDVRARLAQAAPSMRSVLLERERLLAGQAARVPKLEASLELLRSRADAMCYQLRNLHSQVLTDPGTHVHAALDEMIERNDMLGDPLADLDADQMVRDLLAEQATATKAPARVSAANPPRQPQKQGTRR
ncbi:MAG TPA: hypothetical protein VK509_23695 [Polyangiales bacterium]|nr:hypothetical protein [Polyangiales bacterium]